MLYFGFCFVISAQSEPRIGDELVIKSPTAQAYQYIKFPKPNILIKRGTVNSYKDVYENEVVINEVLTKDNGDVHVKLKNKDGTNFFGYVSIVKANYSKAIESKELVITP
ncbi:hypothetical protein [Winogradskyella bathintestinalis]|uniref:Uncharacterized protein n=1 Tax=Winogradskyella bathintestinalis TaxID=3035208 RepID=A0ABT7ZT87_9FLAO|nr:hypothetical protein [Winogradskyella bathintestinalis]MDN3492237.1 hypothetical protein [Winogradskyella bathintestinalis]